jgi:hypothetical protein
VTPRYLLPCSCGREIPVHPQQAGGVVKCDCGKSVDVPTLLAMADLRQAESAVVQPTKQWGARENVIMLGSLVVLTALGLAVYLLMTAPPPPQVSGPPSPETIRNQFESMSASERLHAWDAIRLVGLMQVEPASQRAYERTRFRWWLWMGIVIAIALVGGGLIFTPLVMKPLVGSLQTYKQKSKIPRS